MGCFFELKTQLEFDVEGEPVPERRSRWSRRGGFMHRDHSADSWKHAARAAAFLAVGRIDGWQVISAGVPIGVDLAFRFPRPAKHFTRRATSPELARAAPIFVAGTPDKDNLEKAILDGLGRFDGLPNLLWSDDRQVVTGRTTKRYANPGETPGVTITIYPATEAHVLMHPKPPLPESSPASTPPVLLTPGEALRIMRLRANLTIPQAAALFGFRRDLWAKWELDVSPAECPEVHVGQLAPHEWCTLMRSRVDLTTRALAAITGLANSWIRRAERGEENPQALVEYWERYELALAKRNHLKMRR